MDKILILGGAGVHLKLVQSAKEKGIYTIVTDYLPREKSPAKIIADYSYDIDINNIEKLKEICINNNVKGVLSSHLDPCQIPYVKLCEDLNYSCYCKYDSVISLCDKKKFKAECIKHGLDVIDDYTIDDIKNGKCIYPVYIKPADSRGSRGQTVCYSERSIQGAILYAQQESKSKEIICERYISGLAEIQLTYFFVDGRCYLVRTLDSVRGSEQDGLNRTAIFGISPSKYTDIYIKECNDKVIEMLKKIGVKDGPVMLQAFYDGRSFLFFDAGYRFPGVDYEKIYNEVYGIDLCGALIDFCLGKKVDIDIPEDSYFLKGKMGVTFFPTLKAGLIKKIHGLDDIMHVKQVISIIKRHNIGDEITNSSDINQRLAEIDILVNDKEDLKHTIALLLSKLKVLDEKKDNMIWGIPQL